MAEEANPPNVDDQFLDLVNELRSRSIFDVLETRQDEEDHTRVLARLLDPQQSGTVAEAVLEKLLDRVGVNESPTIHGVRRLERLSSLDTDSLPDDRPAADADLDGIQFDILVDTSVGLFDFELKTKDSLKESQYKRQIRRLEAEVDPGYAGEVSGDEAEKLQDDLGLDWVKSDEWTFVHLYKGSDDQPSNSVVEHSAYHSLDWKHVADAVEDEIGRLEPKETQWATAWIDHLRDHLIDDVSFSPSTKLQCLYPSQADRLDISEDPLGLDRKRLFNEFREWFVQEYNVGDDEEYDDGQTVWKDRITSSFAKGTKIIWIREQDWPSEEDDADGIWIEVLARDKRMKDGHYYGGKGSKSEYRTNDAHIEVSVRYGNDDPDVRDEFIGYFEDADGFPTSDRAVGPGDFELTKAGNEGDLRNKFHVYSRQIRIEQGGPEVLEELKQATQLLVAEATPAIDEYVEEEL